MKDLTKILIHDLELEEIIIASLIVDYSVTDIIISNLKAEDFYNIPNQILFTSCKEIYLKGTKIDLIILHQELKKSEQLDEVGGQKYINRIINKVGSTANIEAHVILLKEMSIKRHITKIGSEATRRSYDQSTTGKEDLNNLLLEVENLQKEITNKKPKDFKETFLEVIKKLEDNEGKDIGISSGFRDYDLKTAGLVAPDLTIIAASPGEGKSTFALNIAKHVSEKHGKVLMFIYEMKAEQLIYKLLSDEFNTSVQDVRRNKLPKNVIQKTKLYDNKLSIYDKGGMTIDDIILTSKFEALKNDLKVIIIDYLQLINLGIYAKRSNTRDIDIGIITRKLKQLAMELNVPIIVLSQVNRDKQRKTYRLSDLRESGNIEQDADNVFFIFRPQRYGIDNYYIGDESIIVDEETTIGILAKCRLGATGQFEMKFKGAFSRFEDKEDVKSINNNWDIKSNKGFVPF